MLHNYGEKFNEAHRILYPKAIHPVNGMDCNILAFIGTDKQESLGFISGDTFELKNMNVIHSKYTTPTNLAIIWDLLDTGRTKSLTIDGADPGAYNLLETHEFREKLLKTINYGFFSIATE